MQDQRTIWAALPADSWREILELGAERRFDRGQTIFLRGDPGDCIMVIVSGIVEIAVTHQSGRKSVLNHMGAGEILGEIALLDGKARSADACATTEVVATIVDRAKVMRHLRERPEALFQLVEALCDKVRNASDMFEAQSLVSASARLARCLLTMTRKWGGPAEDGIRLSQSFSQTEIGDFAGLARENVNRHLRNWAQEGILTFEKGELTLHDPDRLAEIAEL